MIIKITREYTSGVNKGKTNVNNYNMNDWGEGLAWVKEVSESDSYPYVVIEIKNDYGQHETFEYDEIEN